MRLIASWSCGDAEDEHGTLMWDCFRLHWIEDQITAFQSQLQAVQSGARVVAEIFGQHVSCRRCIATQVEIQSLVQEDVS